MRACVRAGVIACVHLCGDHVRQLRSILLLDGAELRNATVGLLGNFASTDDDWLAHNDICRRFITVKGLIHVYL